MKDFYDLWRISELFELDGPALAKAVRSTFQRREMLLPSHVPVALTEQFAEDPAKRQQWQAFAGQSTEPHSGEGGKALSETPSLEEIISSMLGNLLRHTREGEKTSRMKGDVEENLSQWPRLEYFLLKKSPAPPPREPGFG